ncbi:MAG: cupredoxin domain-containing protein [Gemmatimonadetes bacterium]|nr:cupredoxin domain-containing protein [Gemmatimonadota bacterium]
MPPVRARLSVALLVSALACGGGGGSDAPTAPAAPSTPSTPSAPTLPTAPAANEIIATTANTFNPATLTVARGTVVTFTFQATTHNVIFNNVTGAPTNISSTSSSSVQRTFSTAGTFGYDCTLHAGMRGSVVVN